MELLNTVWLRCWINCSDWWKHVVANYNQLLLYFLRSCTLWSDRDKLLAYSDSAEKINTEKVVSLFTRKTLFCSPNVPIKLVYFLSWEPLYENLMHCLALTCWSSFYVDNFNEFTANRICKFNENNINRLNHHHHHPYSSPVSNSICHLSFISLIL